MSVATLITGGLLGRPGSIIKRGLSSYVGLPEPPPTGKEYTTCGSLGSGDWLGAGSSPAVVVGDIFVLSQKTSPSNYTITCNSDGTIIVNSGGDTSRQSFANSIFRVAGLMLDGPTTIWLNEVAPIWSGVVLDLNQQTGILITPIDLRLIAVSPSGDALSFSIAAGGLPPGLSITNGNQISGTATAVGNYTFRLNATDAANVTSTSGNCQINTQMAGSTVPPTWQTAPYIGGIGIYEFPVIGHIR